SPPCFFPAGPEGLRKKWTSGKFLPWAPQRPYTEKESSPHKRMGQNKPGPRFRFPNFLDFGCAPSTDAADNDSNKVRPSGTAIWISEQGAWSRSGIPHRLLHRPGDLPRGTCPEPYPRVLLSWPQRAVLALPPAPESSRPLPGQTGVIPGVAENPAHSINQAGIEKW